MASWLLGMNGGGAGGAGGITQTTDTLANIELLTPALGDQGFPSDDARTLVDITDGAWAYYQDPIVQTTDTLATIEALTPGLGDQGFPTDDPRLLIDQTGGSWTSYLPTPETLFDIDFTSATAYNFLTDGPAGDGVHTTNGWTVTVSGSANVTTLEINANGLDIRGAGAGALQMYWDPAQWGTLTDRDAHRSLIKYDTGTTDFDANNQLCTIYVVSNSGGAVATQPRCTAGARGNGGQYETNVAAYYSAWVENTAALALQQWYEALVFPNATVLGYSGTSATLPDMGALTQRAYVSAGRSVVPAAEKVWDPLDTPLYQLTIAPQSGAMIGIIERMVIQRIPLETP